MSPRYLNLSFTSTTGIQDLKKSLFYSKCFLFYCYRGKKCAEKCWKQNKILCCLPFILCVKVSFSSLGGRHLGKHSQIWNSANWRYPPSPQKILEWLFTNFPVIFLLRSNSKSFLELNFTSGLPNSNSFSERLRRIRNSAY